MDTKPHTVTTIEIHHRQTKKKNRKKERKGNARRNDEDNNLDGNMPKWRKKNPQKNTRTQKNMHTKNPKKTNSIHTILRRKENENENLHTRSISIQLLQTHMITEPFDSSVMISENEVVHLMYLPKNKVFNNRKLLHY